MNTEQTSKNIFMLTKLVKQPLELEKTFNAASSSNFETQRYQNESKCNPIHSTNNLPEIKDGHI